MLKTHGKSLEDGSLLILMTEVEGPLTVETINDSGSFQPLSPANILTMKSKVVMPPPGKSLARVSEMECQHCAIENHGRFEKQMANG